MLCTRCGGLLLQNWWDSRESDHEQSPGTRCVNCGCIDDPVMRANLRRRAPVRLTSTRGRLTHAEFSGLSRVKPDGDPML